MLILLLCLCVALIVYTLIVTNSKKQGTDSVKRRLSALSKDMNVEGIHGEVLAEIPLIAADAVERLGVLDVYINFLRILFTGAL